MRKLKRGCTLFESTTPGQYFLGTGKRAIRLYTREQKFIAEELLCNKNGEDFAEIAELAIPAHNLLAELAHHHLLDLSQGSVTLSKRFISKVEERAAKNSKPNRDAAFIQLQNRIAPELMQTTWIDGVTDSGIEILNSRQSYLVEISGGNRVATLLYPILLASGLTQTRYTSTARGSQPLVGDCDIAVAGIQSSKIGFAFVKEQEPLRREYSLFPLDKGANYLDEISTPELRVHCGEIDPEQLSVWMSTGQRFMHIPTPLADMAQIGPLVIPGLTPCLRCAQLSVREQSGITQSREVKLNGCKEYPQVAAHFIAALAASQILAYLDAMKSTSQMELVAGRIITVDYQSLMQLRVATVARHPLCGCAF